MRKSIILMIVIGYFFTTSCNSTIMRIFGFRNPKIETKQSVFKFLTKIHEDTNDVYTLDTSLFQNLKKKQFKPGMNSSFRPVQIRMYGKTGEPVMQWASCEGFISDLNIFDTLPPRIVNGLDTSLNLEEDLQRYYTLEGKPAHIIVPMQYDYYILIYFAKYFPKFSKESFSQVNHYIAKHPDIKFKVFKINVDVQEFWNVDLKVESQTQVGGSR
jgi:hypothetical protein